LIAIEGTSGQEDAHWFEFVWSKLVGQAENDSILGTAIGHAGAIALAVALFAGAALSRAAKLACRCYSSG
jgi:hypothetical protein